MGKANPVINCQAKWCHFWLKTMRELDACICWASYPMPAPKRGRIFQNEYPHEHKGKYHSRLAIYEEVWKCPCLEEPSLKNWILFIAFLLKAYSPSTCKPWRQQ